MPHHISPKHQESQKLLIEFLQRIHEASAVIDHVTTFPETVRVAQERLATHQAYLIELIAIGLDSERSPPF